MFQIPDRPLLLAINIAKLSSKNLSGEYRAKIITPIATLAIFGSVSAANESFIVKEDRAARYTAL